MHEDSESAGNSDSDNQIHALLFCFAFVLIRSPVCTHKEPSFETVVGRTGGIPDTRSSTLISCSKITFGGFKAVRKVFSESN
jgi:hypothetical protein